MRDIKRVHDLNIIYERERNAKKDMNELATSSMIAGAVIAYITTLITQLFLHEFGFEIKYIISCVTTCVLAGFAVHSIVATNRNTVNAILLPLFARMEMLADRCEEAEHKLENIKNDEQEIEYVGEEKRNDEAEDSGTMA